MPGLAITTSMTLFLGAKAKDETSYGIFLDGWEGIREEQRTIRQLVAKLLQATKDHQYKWNNQHLELEKSYDSNESEAKTNLLVFLILPPDFFCRYWPTPFPIFHPQINK